MGPRNATEDRVVEREQTVHAIEPVSPNPDSEANRLFGWSGGVTALGTVLAAVPHGGVELPVVSPDGRWIAYFRHVEGSPQPSANSLIHGRGLSGVSLSVRAVDAADAEEGSRLAAVSGACWPAWTGDARSLFFVTYDDRGAASLGRFDVVTGQIDRKSLGLRHLLAVRPSFDGTRLAALTYDQDPRRLRLVVVDWLDARVIRVPLSEPNAMAQLMPAWADSQTLLYVEAAAHEASDSHREANLLRLSLDGTGPAERIGSLRLPVNPIDALMIQQGILAHFDANHGGWLYRDHEGQLQQLDLRTQQTSTLSSGIAAAAWYADPWLVLGGSRDLTLYNARASVAPSNEDERVGGISLRLLDGQWAPRWADAERQTLILVGRGQRADSLALYQLWLAPEVERSSNSSQ
ncbi:MAG: hypothetical protein AAF916_04345 [Planctomycetota bacterium]